MGGRNQSARGYHLGIREAVLSHMRPRVDPGRGMLPLPRVRLLGLRLTSNGSKREGQYFQWKSGPKREEAHTKRWPVS